jgi:hypothetical protein
MMPRPFGRGFFALSGIGKPVHLCFLKDGQKNTVYVKHNDFLTLMIFWLFNLAAPKIETL